MDTAQALKLLGFAEGTVKSKADLEKLRTRSKDLYKKYAGEKREHHAKRVMQAFEVLKTKYSKLQEGGVQRSSSIQSNGSSKQLESVEKPASVAQVSKAARAAEKPPGGAPERQRLERQRSERLGNVAKSLSMSGSTSVMPGTALTRKRPHAKTARAPEPPLSCRASGGRSLGKLGSSGSLQKQASSRSVGGSLGKAPANPQAPPAHEREAYLTCSCGESYRAKRFPRPVQKISGFLCPACRVRRMDPFNQVLDAKRGLLKLVMVQRPYVPAEARREGSFRLRFPVPRLSQWRKQGHSIEARMCCLDTVSATQAWSDALTIEINGRKAVDIQPPQAGHKRRDVPENISAQLRSGNNVVKVTLRDDYVQRFAIAFVRTMPHPPKEMCKRVPVLKAVDCKQMVVDLLFSSMLEGKGNEVECDEGSNISRLLCPITMGRITTPVRGTKCRHLQCFDLEAYLVSNLRMAAFNNRWHCPVCNLLVMPPKDLFIDTYLLDVLGKAGEDAEEVSFDATGGWTVSSTAAPDVDSEDDDGALPLSAFVPVPNVEQVEEAAPTDEVDVVAGPSPPSVAGASPVVASPRSPTEIGPISGPLVLARSDTAESFAAGESAEALDGGMSSDGGERSEGQDGSDCEDSDLLSDEEGRDACGPPQAPAEGSAAEAGQAAAAREDEGEAPTEVPTAVPTGSPTDELQGTTSPEMPWARPRFSPPVIGQVPVSLPKSPMPSSDAGSDAEDAPGSDSEVDLVSDGCVASNDEPETQTADDAADAVEVEEEAVVAAAEGPAAAASVPCEAPSSAGDGGRAADKVTPNGDAVKLVKFIVDNTQLRAKSPGLGYRLTKDSKDMAPGKPYVKWGEIAEGELDGDWLKIGEMYLPLISNGAKVLSLVESREAGSPAVVPDPYLDLTAQLDAADLAAAAAKAAQEAVSGGAAEQAAVPPRAAAPPKTPDSETVSGGAAEQATVPPQAAAPLKTQVSEAVSGGASEQAAVPPMAAAPLKTFVSKGPMALPQKLKDLDADRALLLKMQEARKGAQGESALKRAKSGDSAAGSLRGSQTTTSIPAASSTFLDRRARLAAEGAAATPAEARYSPAAAGAPRPAAAAAFAAAAAAGAAARALAASSAAAAVVTVASLAPPPPEAAETTAPAVPPLARKRSRLLACVDEDEDDI